MTNNINKSHKNKNLDFEKIPKISKFQQGRMKSNRETNTRHRSSLPLYDYQSRPAANASAINSSKDLQIDFNCNGNLSSKLLHIAAVSVETTLHTKRKWSQQETFMFIMSSIIGHDHIIVQVRWNRPGSSGSCLSGGLGHRLLGALFKIYKQQMAYNMKIHQFVILGNHTCLRIVITILFYY